MLVIYNQNETSFNNLGLGILKDYLSSPKITEVLNGLYNLEFSYKRNGWLSEYLVEGNIIKANGQLFRIRNINKDIKKSSIDVLAKHIWFDLEINNWLEDVAPTDKYGHEALAWILSHAKESNSFSVTGDCDLRNSARYVRMNPIEAIYNADNALLNRFGGELEINNYNITLHKKRGSNTGIEIRQKKNVTGAKYSVDLSELITRVMPIGNDGLLLPEKYVDSSLINNYYAPFYYKLDVDVGVDASNGITENDCYDVMRAEAQKLFDSGVDKPRVSIEIDFIELSKTTEYSQYSNLETAHLGDTCRVYIPDLDIDVNVRIIETVFDCILNRITNIVLGNPMPNYVSNNNKSETKIKNAINDIDSTYLEKARNEATKIINHPFGGYVYISKNTGELFIMDTDDPLTATKVWKWGLGGLGYSSTGINGTYDAAITQNGSIVANFITTGTISTSVLSSDVITTTNFSAQNINADKITSGSIKSSNYVADTSGTKINLTDGTIDTKDFKVSSTGGITATAGTIGGWTIRGSYLGSVFGSTTSTYFLSEAGKTAWYDGVGYKDWYMYFKSKFGITSDGILYANDAVIKGEVTASSGNIGGWTIGSSSLYTSGNDLYLGTSGITATIALTSRNNIIFKAGSNFGVDTSGTLYAADAILYNATISGTINSSTIRANWNSSDNAYRTIISSTGTIKYYNGIGFFSCGHTTDHPWLSAVNVNQLNGVNFYTGTTWNSSGTLCGSIDFASNSTSAAMRIKSNNNLNIDSGANMGIDSSGYLAIRTDGSYSTGSYSGSIYIYANQNINLNSKNGYVYVGSQTTSNSRVAADSSGPSSRCLKKNITKFTDNEFSDALQLLKDIDIYDYKYKYNIHPKENQYGFIIDDLLENDLAKKFLYFKDERAGINKNNYLDYCAPEENPNKYPIIDFKRYDEETLIKYLLVVCKSLYKEIIKIKEEII